ncbi:YegP family protein [Chitinophaga rhizophila]|uniref:YegP family protein n=1 Tax=Chitinophaga rhizophila TaxID=2866212 RepID=A0ABS7GB32_9BACT|nr:YegP family protein [Chitinophaga rhizophila]MBW8684350.1 YegP family protein [Chitinophaga rhizophila]
MKNPKFELFSGIGKNDYFFNLKAGNGEKILGSESYTSKHAAVHSIASIKRNAPYYKQYERRFNSEKDSYSFVLKAENGEIIGRSETYPSAYSRDEGIEAVRRNAPEATTEDLT